MKNQETLTLVINRIEEKGTAAAFMLFPVFFVAAQVMHPDLFHVQLITDGDQWINHFRGQHLLHAAHLLEFICAPLLLIMALHYKKELQSQTPVLIFAAAIMIFTGSFMLLGNKSAFCLTISGFDRLNDQQLYQMVPGLDILLQKKGMLSVLWLLPLLPLGYVLAGVSLYRTDHVPKWQSIMIITGSLMLANPEIEVINFFASFFLAAGLIPYSIRLFQQATQQRDIERI